MMRSLLDNLWEVGWSRDSSLEPSWRLEDLLAWSTENASSMYRLALRFLSLEPRYSSSSKHSYSYNLFSCSSLRISSALLFKYCDSYLSSLALVVDFFFLISWVESLVFDTLVVRRLAFISSLSCLLYSRLRDLYPIFFLRVSFFDAFDDLFEFFDRWEFRDITELFGLKEFLVFALFVELDKSLYYAGVLFGCTWSSCKLARRELILRSVLADMDICRESAPTP